VTYRYLNIDCRVQVDDAQKRLTIYAKEISPGRLNTLPFTDEEVDTEPLRLETIDVAHTAPSRASRRFRVAEPGGPSTPGEWMNSDHSRTGGIGPSPSRVCRAVINLARFPVKNREPAALAGEPTSGLLMAHNTWLHKQSNPQISQIRQISFLQFA